MSENGNNLEEGNTVAEKNLFLFFARHNFKNCSVSVIDTATQKWPVSNDRVAEGVNPCTIRT
jgi:hypothetical protein